MHSLLWQHLFSSGVGIWMQLPQIHHLGTALFTAPGCGSSSSSARSLLVKSRLPRPLSTIRMSNRLRCPSSKLSINVWFSKRKIDSFHTAQSQPGKTDFTSTMCAILYFTSISSLASSVSLRRSIEFCGKLPGATIWKFCNNNNNSNNNNNKY